MAPEIVHVKIVKAKADGKDVYIGTGIEYPGIILSGGSVEEIEEKFLECLPGYKKILEKYNMITEDIWVSQLEVDE